MELFQNLILLENQKTAAREIDYSISIINKIYNEWKKRRRRINAVDIVTTSINKISTINPAVIQHIHAAGKKKLAIIIMRCLDIPMWKPLETKEKAYNKLYPLIKKLETEVPNTTTGGNLRDIIMTRFSACLCYKESRGKIFIAYEKRLPKSYLDFLFGSDKPEKTFRMQSLKLPDNFDDLYDILLINHEKAAKRNKL